MKVKNGRSILSRIKEENVPEEDIIYNTEGQAHILSSETYFSIVFE